MHERYGILCVEQSERNHVPDGAGLKSRIISVVEDDDADSNRIRGGPCVETLGLRKSVLLCASNGKYPQSPTIPRYWVRTRCFQEDAQSH